jgi:hypothetical protein
MFRFPPRTDVDARLGTVPVPDRARPLAAVGPVPVLTVAAVPPAVLVGGVIAVALLAGVLFLVTTRTRTATESDETGDEAEPAHPDAWRVRRLLDEHGGRLPQSEIVERTGWSKSKVSRVLSAMAEDEQVRKIRLGRENLVTRPGDVPEHAGSPFDDESPKG